MGQFMDLDGAKPCLLKILHRHLLAPHGAETIVGQDNEDIRRKGARFE
jgi:hypothetical protein